MKLQTLLTAASLWLALSGGMLRAAPVVEEGRVRLDPWSGYWWPHYQGLILGPLSKYDDCTGRNAAQWEKDNHPTDVPKWFGYCHAWAASVVTEEEPKTACMTKNRNNEPIQLGVGDQKALLAASHAQDVANVYGDRFGDQQGSEDQADIAPDALWRLLKLFVKQEGVPLVLDVENGDEVWNYPVYAYRIQYELRTDREEQTARLSLWMADDFVAPDFVGLKPRKQDYLFAFKMRGGAVIAGSGRWIETSVDDHPDFAWYPYVTLPENPEVDYAQVRQMLGRSTTNEQPAGTSDSGTSAAAATTTTGSNSTTTATATPATTGGNTSGPVPGTVPATAVASPASVLGPNELGIVSPQELAALIQNQTSSFALNMDIDRLDGGKYAVGDLITVRVSSEKPGYLYLLIIDKTGDIGLLYPQKGDDNRIAAKSPVVIPGANAKYRYRVGEPIGTNRIKALVTSQPLEFSGLAPSIDVSQADGAQSQTGVTLFRWSPTQQHQMQKLLKGTTGHNAGAAALLEKIDPRQTLGDFAQDEAAFYVGPRPKQPPAQNAPPQEKPRGK